MFRNWWVSRRNALLASARCQQLALRFLPTRVVARKHARRLFDLVAGFTYSQTLFACVELDLFARVAAVPMSLDALASATDLPVPALDRLVGAAVALDLLERLADGRITLGVAGAALVGNPGVAEMVRHHRHLYADLADPVALLRHPGGGALAAFWDYARGAEAEAVAGYSSLMAASLAEVGRQLLDAHDVSQYRRLLDVGGGQGQFLAEVRRRAPRLELGLFDLPAVADRARDRLASDLALHPGDFRYDSLPEGYDCVTLVRVLHDHDDAIAAALLHSICQALPPGGTLLIAEPMIGTRGNDAVGATYFALYLLAMGSGRARTPATIGKMLENAGFARWRSVPTRLPLSASLIVASIV